ncbi:MAG: hypothetical protein A4E53_01885 [Pelotomaculum sp. PtaB.Bin104]|nr:MAG: hypothetical protein A4E53_01885 [Pelotomaculum sp. PtaB.Bin104]
MQSEIAQRLKLKYSPVAVLLQTRSLKMLWSLLKDAGDVLQPC